jgi:hypothetical protein
MLWKSKRKRKKEKTNKQTRVENASVPKGGKF